MNFKPSLLIMILALCVGVSTPSFAGKKPRPGSADARVKTITYNEHEVFALNAHYGFSTAIEFSQRERIETISLGDSEAWQVMKPNRPNILFIKPLEENAQTNMTVLTSKRIYTFELTADQAGSYYSEDLTFRLKFRYPAETDYQLANIGSASSSYDPLSHGEPTGLNFDYSYSGSKRLRPIRAFDDGTFTYLQFNDFEVMPAVFAVDERGHERLVNFNVEGKYLVIANIGRQFTLRDGDTATCIFNDDHPAPPDETTKEIIPVAEIEEKEFEIAAGIPIPGQKPRFGEEEEGFFGKLASYFEAPKTTNLNN